MELGESITVLVRQYFSGKHLWAAQHLAALARQIEDQHTGGPSFDVAHRSYVIASVLSCVAFLEAAVNEVFQDAFDGYGSDRDGYLAPLSETERRRLGAFWQSSRSVRSQGVLEKFRLMLVLTDRPPLPPGRQPMQDVALMIKLRNALVHFSPETLGSDEPHELEKHLGSKFASCRLFENSGNPWWGDHCLGAGCAEWAHRSATSFADAIFGELGIAPNYQRLRDSRTGELLGRAPGQ
jgi:hypothetical protein